MSEYVYNNVRQEFIEMYEDDGSQTHNLQVFFNTLKRLESKYNQPFEAMEWERFVKVLVEASGISYVRYRQNVVYARKYIYWLKEKNKISKYRDNVNQLYKHFQQLSKQHLQLYQVYDLSENYKKLSWGSPDDLGKYLDEIFQPITANTTDNFLRLFIWLLYLGFNPIDAVRIKKQDVYTVGSTTKKELKRQPSAKRIVYNQTSVMVPEAATSLFNFMLRQNSVEVKTKSGTKEFMYDDPQKLIGTYSYRYSSEPRTDEQNAKTMAHRLSMFYVHNIGEDDNRLTTNNIVTAGVFYNMYCNNSLQKSDVNNSYSALSKQRLQVKTYNDFSKRSAITDGQVNYKYNSERKILVEQEYRSWKQAFHPVKTQAKASVKER